MDKEDKRKRNARHAESVAKKRGGSLDFTKEIPANAPTETPENDSHQIAWKSLKPVFPDPNKGFQPLSSHMVDRITRATMKEMKRLAQERHISLDWKYWEQITRSILGQPSSDIAIICPSPAGSGKSTWILAFLLAIKSLFSSDSELESSLIGVAVILQKVEDLNCLAEALNHECSPDAPFMVPLQGWNTSGKKRGFCQNAGVEGYTDCPRTRCPHAAQCPILEFREKAIYAPVIGLTQERFYLLRDDDLSPILKRKCQDMTSRSRRYILFDEKFQMAPVTALNTAQINEASTELDKIILKYDIADTRVRSL